MDNHQSPSLVCHSKVYFTEAMGTPYLTEPGCALISAPMFDLSATKDFLSGFDTGLEFPEYLNDPTKLPPSEAICKFAGQLCYLSFGKNRSMNHKAEDYFKNIRESGHGSVLEHANFGFLLYGISRSLTHELVRHRVGIGFSQVSQRYVDGKTLRFVERPEYQGDDFLHGKFVRRIDLMSLEYEQVADHLLKKLQASFSPEELKLQKKSDLRKRVNQAARSVLPNETEAPIVVTANVRSLRHLLEMRASKPAEVEIRRAAFKMYSCVVRIAPILFQDYKVIDLPEGTFGLETTTRKV
jgi:thymidylate synthase (FAD)